MDADEDMYYKAVLARDPRFDGKFFIGVKTTGIYCRPICPAKPKRQNVEFFASALLAEKSGYRPCLRCRPESAPMSPAWVGKSAVVQRALKRIADHALVESREEEFASQFGMSARHLRRLFEAEIGKTPKQISDQNRLNFARKLVTETSLPITEIAYASGFSSLRRFNDAMKQRFRRSPSAIRLRSGSAKDDSAIRLQIAYRPPFDWDSLLAFYRSHAVKPIETVTDKTYRRVFQVEQTVGSLTVEHAPSESSLVLSVRLENPRGLYAVVQKVRHMFDLECDPIFVSNAFSQCRVMRRLGDRYPGLRLARGFDPYETAVCTILGQLVSTEQAGKLKEQLVVHYGEKIKDPDSDQPAFLFPSPKVLANQSLTHVRTTAARRLAIQEFSRAILHGRIRLDTAQDPMAFREQLLQIKGIGQWTAHYISLRAIGDTDAFPESDLILKRAIDTHPKLKLDVLKPWRAYAAIYLWKEYAKSLSNKKGKF